MLGASISDGDFVVVDRSVEARPGHIVVALVHGDRTMKRLRRRSGQLWLVPEAGDGDVYPETLVDQDVEVWGRGGRPRPPHGAVKWPLLPSR